MEVLCMGVLEVDCVGVVDTLVLCAVFMVEVVEGVELVVGCVVRRVVRLVLWCVNGRGYFLRCFSLKSVKMKGLSVGGFLFGMVIWADHTALGIQARTSEVGAGRLNHRAPIHCHKVNSAEWTRLEFCLWLSFTTAFPLNQAFHLCLSFPRTGFQQNVPMIANSTPRGSSTSNRSTHRH